MSSAVLVAWIAVSAVLANTPPKSGAKTVRTAPASKAKEVFLFIDTNSSPGEVKTARELAAARGQEFIVVPKVTAEHAALLEEIDRTQREVITSSDRSARTRLRELEERRKKMPRINLQEDLRAVAKKIRSGGKKLKHVTVSGHDGGGNFGGSLASLDPLRLNEDLGEDATVLNDVQSVGLLGCYAGTVGMAKKLREAAFPNARFIVGYDGSAPLGERQSGWAYYRAVLGLEKKIMAAKDKAEVKRAVDLANTGIRQVAYPSFFVAPPACGADYFYSKAHGGLRKVEVSRCSGIIEEKTRQFKLLTEYYYGQKPIPENTASGELRDAYSFVRREEDCLGDNSSNAFPGHSVALLLFWESTRKNFIRLRGSELNKCRTELSAALGTLADPARDRDIERAVAENQKFFDGVTSNMKKAKTLEQIRTAVRAAMEAIEKKDSEIRSRGSKDGEAPPGYDNFLKRFTAFNEMFAYSGYISTPQLYEKALKAFEKKQAAAPSSGIPGAISKMETAAELLDPEKLSRMDRKDLRDALFKIGAATFSIYSLPGKHQEKFSCLDSASRKINSELFDMGCAPFSWHEFDPNGQTEDSLCGEQGLIRTSGGQFNGAPAMSMSSDRMGRSNLEIALFTSRGFEGAIPAQMIQMNSQGEAEAEQDPELTALLREVYEAQSRYWNETQANPPDRAYTPGQQQQQPTGGQQQQQPPQQYQQGPNRARPNNPGPRPSPPRR